MNKKTAFHTALMVLLLGAATAAGYLLRHLGFPGTNNVLLYLLAVLLTAWRTDGYVYGLVSSIIATFAYNFFFTEPYYSLNVEDPSYWMTFAVMTVVAVITCTLTSHVKQSAQEAREAEQRSIRTRELAEQERYRGNLLRAISHDLRTPLSGIIGTSEMLMAMTDGDDPRHDLMRDIHDSAGWLKSMVENILSLTRLQDGKLILDKEPEAAEEVVDAAVNYVLQHAAGREISVRIPDALLMVPMDAKLIRQVLINLLDNAAAHTAPEDEIAVTVDTEGRFARFTVTDGGSGIDENDLPNIFQMFYTSKSRQADSRHHGIGLGLTICQAIVKAHGGDIMARNRTDHRGAEFTFTLPLEVKNEHV